MQSVPVEDRELQHDLLDFEEQVGRILHALGALGSKRFLVQGEPWLPLSFCLY
jgi:hypothetical protein